MATKIRLRRGSQSEWLEANPVLDIAEFGYETDTGRAKIGNGLDEWSALSYFTPALDDEFDTLPEITQAQDAFTMLVYNNLIGGSGYSKMSRFNFLKGDSIKIIPTVNEAKAYTGGYENQLIYIPETETIYRYFILESGSLVADNTHVLITGDVPTPPCVYPQTRWVAVAGQYKTTDINLSAGKVIKIGDIQVLKGRLANISNLGSGVDLEAHRNKINEILAMLREHGLIGQI